MSKLLRISTVNIPTKGDDLSANSWAKKSGSAEKNARVLLGQVSRSSEPLGHYNNFELYNYRAVIAQW